MNLKAFIEDALNQSHTRVSQVLDGITREELLYQPAPDANHIWFILWHLARAEDQYASSFITRAGELWETQGWYRKFNLPLRGQGTGYTPEQVRALPAPELRDFLEYSEAVRSNTLDYLHRLTPAQLNRPHEPLPDSIFSRMGRSLSGWEALRNILAHEHHHHGQLDYLKGLARSKGDRATH